ncbi:MAG: DUF2202 domain-containing protein [Anaerolineaceae bacterium]|nr:DUF2202 domain-containing protein [Anaerolineaceae bacterium]
MKKTILKITILTAILGILGFNNLESVSAFSNQSTVAKEEQQTTSIELTQNEIDALLFMREEEKLARDVYQTLFDKWNLAIFENIAKSEQRHMDAVKTLIFRYGLEDPMLAEAGEFTNQDLQELYDSLVVQGSQSISDALLVGGAIEEIDILDLQDGLKETTNADIVRVFESLLKGSYSHLKAFANNYNRQTGETYQPQFMTQIVFDEIINQSNANGNGRFQSTTTQGRRGGRR